MTSNEIRRLTAEEVPLLMPGAREFYAEGRLYGKLNEEHCAKTLASLIQAGSAVCFASAFRGAIGGLFFPDLVTADLCCMEHFWFVRQEERGTLGVRLLKALEAECEQRGVRRLLLMHMIGPDREAFEHFYTRMGYELREQVYVRSWEAL
jgi:GNAT superfamily N-acetyltransferase